jgi:hypothetical protein
MYIFFFLECFNDCDGCNSLMECKECDSGLNNISDRNLSN